MVWCSGSKGWVWIREHSTTTTTTTTTKTKTMTAKTTLTFVSSKCLKQHKPITCLYSNYSFISIKYFFTLIIISDIGLFFLCKLCWLKYLWKIKIGWFFFQKFVNEIKMFTSLHSFQNVYSWKINIGWFFQHV